MNRILLVSFLLSLSLSLGAQTSGPANVVTVQGQAKFKTTANQVSMFAGMNASGASAEKAQAELVARVKKLRSELTKEFPGIKSINIFDPRISWSSTVPGGGAPGVGLPGLPGMPGLGPPGVGAGAGRKKAWHASVQVSIVVRAGDPTFLRLVQTVGDFGLYPTPSPYRPNYLIDPTTGLPIGRGVGGPGEFTLEYSLLEPKKAKAKVLQLAFEDARQKAHALAQLAGKKLGEVVTITEIPTFNSAGIDPITGLPSGLVATRAKPTPEDTVSPSSGTVEFSSELQVQFILEGTSR